MGGIGPQALGSVLHLAVISLTALCDTLHGLRHSTAQADILKSLSVQCDVSLSLLLQRSAVARSLLLHDSIVHTHIHTHSGDSTPTGNNTQVQETTTSTGCTGYNTAKFYATAVHVAVQTHLNLY